MANVRANDVNVSPNERVRVLLVERTVSNVENDGGSGRDSTALLLQEAGYEVGWSCIRERKERERGNIVSGEMARSLSLFLSHALRDLGVYVHKRILCRHITHHTLL